MKIKKLTLRNFKRFDSKVINFVTADEKKINDFTVLVGENGSGKSSILEAIILLIASKTRANFDIKGFDYPGYDYSSLRSGKTALKCSAQIELTELEINATFDYAKRLQQEGGSLGLPSKNTEVTLELDYEHGTVKEVKSKYQLSGHQHAKQLSAYTEDKNSLFDSVGNIYWYHDGRNSFHVSDSVTNDISHLNSLRTFLANAYTYHIALLDKRRTLKPGQFDFYEKLEGLFSRVFEGRKLVGSAPDFDLYESAPAPDFFLSDGKNEYEIGSMSAGERAIFPMLLDFARWNINNSIIIIDEIELHLHPPLQQSLVRILPKLGNNNQFIITTHSDDVLRAVSGFSNNIIRLQHG